MLNHRQPQAPKSKVRSWNGFGDAGRTHPYHDHLFETEVFHKLLKRCGPGTSDKLAAKVGTRASIAITATQLTESWEKDKREMYFGLYDTTIGLDGICKQDEG